MQAVLNYRRATLSDLHQLKELGLKSYAIFSNVLEPLEWEKLKQGLGNEERLKDLLSVSACFVCEDKNRLVGMAHLVPSGNAWEVFEAHWSYIRLVGVLPEYKGKGIATLLTRQCINYANEKGETLIALHTSEFMDAARHIYENLGFKKTREIEPRFGKRYWLYQLDLSAI